jgi:hypothetical protein
MDLLSMDLLSMDLLSTGLLGALRAIATSAANRGRTAS